MPRKLANDVPPQALCVIELYGDSGTFLSRMNPSTQIIAAENPEKAYKSEISLTKVKLAFGMPFLKVWLMAQLENLNDFCGTKSKMTIDQMDELTGIIAVDYGYLRAAEILLFFHRLKKGQYGQFYGSVDPLMIASALFQHVKDRQIEISRIEAAENQKRLDNQRKEWKNNAISREEYENIKQSQVSLN
ncbi:MAG: DUF6633 family protein [Bacteroidales bacterium]|nr:hypothetical protein [Bacteroidales bacterium]